MALETVEILVKDDAVPAQPVDGVVVRVYDEGGATLITSGTTGAVESGKVQFTLDAATNPTRFQLRFYINGGSIVSPQYIDVYTPASGSPTGTNNFEVTASLFTLPSAVDSRLCRASGYVKGPDGRPRRGIDMHFVPAFNPLVVDGVGVLGERVATRTDGDGYVSVDLYRNGFYRATVESHENVIRQIEVPDRASININHLLFPIVFAVSWNPAAITVAAGSEIEVIPELTATDYRVLEGTALDDVKYDVDDTDIATVTPLDDKLIIRGVAPGTTNLRVERLDESIVYIPDPGIDGSPATITVT